MKWFLVLALSVAMVGCVAHRRAPKPIVEPAFPIVVTSLPETYDAWVCQELTGFQRCDAANYVGGQLCWNVTNVDVPTECVEFGKVIRVDQPNGLVVYWRARMTQ